MMNSLYTLRFLFISLITFFKTLFEIRGCFGNNTKNKNKTYFSSLLGLIFVNISFDLRLNKKCRFGIVKYFSQ